MAYIRLAPLFLFLLATSAMFPMKIEATCNGRDACSPFEMPPCADGIHCRCIPWGLVAGECRNPSVASIARMIDEHPNLCQSNDECMKKGSGNFCARYPNPDIEYGWCIDSDSEVIKSFMKRSMGIAKVV